MVPQFWPAKIEPLSDSGLLREHYKMGLAKSLTINPIELLSGDPLSGLDCTQVIFHVKSPTKMHPLNRSPGRQRGEAVLRAVPPGPHPRADRQPTAVSTARRSVWFSQGAWLRPRHMQHTGWSISKEIGYQKANFYQRATLVNGW